MRRSLKIAIPLCAAAAAAVLALRLGSGSDGEPVWKTAVVARGDVEKLVTATGTVEPLEQVEVSTEVSGTISKIYVDFNDKVKKGQLIAQLDQSKLKAALAQQQAAVDAAKNEYSYQKKQRERTALLVQKGAAGQQELEDAEYRLENARTSLARAQTQLDQAKVDLRNTSIHSPIDGVVLDRQVEEGQTVAASMNAPTLFVIARNLEKMKVETSVDEADVGQVKAGQKVRFRVDAFPERQFEGVLKMVRLSPTSVNNVVTYTVEIEAENPDGLLVPGLTANVDIIVAAAYGTPTAPVAAERFRMAPLARPKTPPPPPGGTKDRPSPEQIDSAQAAGTLLWTLENGQPRPRRVVLGVSDGTLTEIVSGLAEGDTVIVGRETAAQTAVSGSAAKSPFMPSPPKNRKRSAKSGPPPQ